MLFLLEEEAGFADEIADGGSADVGKDVQRAQAPLVEDGEQDAFAVSGLLREDAAAGAGSAGTTAASVAEALGLGRLPGCEPLGELVQFVSGEPSQDRMGQPVDDPALGGAEVAVRKASRA